MLLLHSKSFLISILILSTLTCCWISRSLLYTTWTLLSLPIFWSTNSSQFYISLETDNFDLTFTNYSKYATNAVKGNVNLIPPILHHIRLGSPSSSSSTSSSSAEAEWDSARKSCLDLHSHWETHLWTDENAGKFVQEKFPELKAMWDGYPYLIQRVDALRYLVLYEYGGVILDMDLKCRRSLGPLRKFPFVAPAATPTGFSISFIMASRQNDLIARIIKNLSIYNRRWLLLPYPTVMFSTGGHFASSIHASLPDRSDYKILSGPRENTKLHTLNGRVSTPLFEHLGSSSWHSFDSNFVAIVVKLCILMLPVVLMIVVCVMLFVADGLTRARGRWRGEGESKDLELNGIDKRSA